MAATTPAQLRDHYADLLILQYKQKPKAYATIQAMVTGMLLPQVTVQTITFPSAPASGTFTLSFTPFGVNQTALTTSALSYSSTAAQVQAALNLLAPLASVTVTGAVTGGFTVTFTGVPPIAPLLTVVSGLATSTGTAVTPVVTQTDVTLLNAIQNAHQLAGVNVAVGTQLNTLGKYAGVVRNINSLGNYISLSDADFLTLIQFAVVTNSLNASYSAIQKAIYQFFPATTAGTPGPIQNFDHLGMRMSYFISTSLGSQNLITALVAQNLLPKPMGVQNAVVTYAPSSVLTSFFGFRTYTLPAQNESGVNTYTSYLTPTPFLTYQYGVTAQSLLLMENGNSLTAENGNSLLLG